jgi:hypothetical protein
MYDNMKAKAKKASAMDKIETYRTGGGVFTPSTDSFDEQILALLGNRAVPLVNDFDSDAPYAAISANVQVRTVCYNIS